MLGVGGMRSRILSIFSSPFLQRVIWRVRRVTE